MTLSDSNDHPVAITSATPNDVELDAIAGKFTAELDELARDLVSQLAPQRKILVVGGAGYIGSALVRKLLATHHRVTVLDDLVYENASSIASLLDVPRFSFIKGDFCDKAVLDQALSGVTDVVLLAALVGDPICKKYSDLARRINLDGTKKLIDTLRDRGTNRFVFLSTCSNYGLRVEDSLATEEAELNPKSLYAETKVAVEEYLMASNASSGFCPTILRAATAYGVSDRMRFDLTVSEFSRTLALARELLVYDENTWRPYCHVDDISAAIMTVLNSPTDKVRSEIFNVGSTEENYTKRMIVDIIRKHTQDGVVKYKEGGFDPRNYRVSFDKIATKLGFQNQHSVTKSIPVLIRSIQSGMFHDVEERTWFYGNYEVRTA